MPNPQKNDDYPSTIPILPYGQRVDAVLADLYPQWSRVQISNWLKSGAITINQNSCKPKDKVFGGERVTLNIPLHQTDQDNLNLEAEDIPLDIAFEDEHLLIVNKPSGLVSHPGAGNRTHTLVNALLHYDATLYELPRAGIIHRLDKDTTGLLIVAKTRDTYNALVRLMQAREIDRRYLALVHGHLISGGTVDTCFGRHPHQRLKMAVTTHGKQAVTLYSLKKQYQHTTLLEVRLMTGRTHQIRVHMAYIKHPIVGDALYGGHTRVPPGITAELRHSLKTFPRQALHAQQVSFIHPINDESVSITAKIPEDFQSLLNQLNDSMDSHD